MFLQGEKRNQIFSPLPFHTLKNVLRYWKKVYKKNLTLIFLWPKIGALRVKMKGETWRKTFLSWLLQKGGLFYI